MQIVINMPEEYYSAIKEIPNRQCTAEMVIIKYGTPLPKGHGRLIDADAFIENESCCGYIEDMDIDSFISVTPTIIEEDKE